MEMLATVFIDVVFGPVFVPSTKKIRKWVELKAREFSEPAGVLLEKLNDIIDSKENLEEGICHSLGIGKVLGEMTFTEALSTLRKGDHIKVMRLGYSHHGIYIGKGMVIHYDDFVIRQSTLAEFAGGDKIILVDEPSPYKRKEIVRRAKSRLGERHYNPVNNNCENFATWCRCGREL